MIPDCNYENICCNKEVALVKDQIKVESKTEIESESVEKILNLSSNSVILESQLEGKSVFYKGKITFYVCYKCSEGLKKNESVVEFSGNLPLENAPQNYSLFVTAKTEKLEADTSNLKLCLISYVGITATLKTKEETKALKNTEGLVCNEKEIESIKEIKVMPSTYSIEEQFEIDSCVKEVLSQTAVATVNSSSMGVGLINVEGNVYLSAVLLQSGDKNNIIREERVFTYKAEIECEDAMPSNLCLVTASVKSFKTDINVDENKNSSVILASVVLNFYSEAFSVENISVCKDVFSITDNLKIEKSKINQTLPVKTNSTTCNIEGKCKLEDIKEGSRFLAVVSERAEITEVEKTGDGFLVTGVLSFGGIFSDSEDNFYTRKGEIPFNCNIESEEDLSLEVSAVANKIKLLVSGEEAEIKYQIIFLCKHVKTVAETVISNVEFIGEKEINDSAISVFIPREGEELWDLSKRLNVSPKTLEASNKELKFPLSGKERIVVFRGE